MNNKDKQVIRRALERAVNHLQTQLDGANERIATLKASVALYQKEIDKYEGELKALGDDE